jgi:hypothetical protein
MYFSDDFCPTAFAYKKKKKRKTGGVNRQFGAIIDHVSQLFL